MNKEPTIIVAVCGASGTIYGVRLVKALLEHGVGVMVILSHAGSQVLSHEMGYDPDLPFEAFLEAYGTDLTNSRGIDLYSQDEIAAAPASGSFRHHGMVVAPCSMKTLAALAAGYADNLITRSCDVALKEKRPLVVVPRETPLNLIHLENLTRLARAGAVVMPPCPSFYTFPETIEDLADTVVARILDHLGVEHHLLARWGT